jgi:hypothetical protein
VIRVLQGANIDREAGHRLFKLQVSATDGGPTAAAVTYDPFSDSNMNAFGALQEAASIISKDENRTRTLHRGDESSALSPLDDLFSDESLDSQPHSIVFAQVRIHVADINDNAPKFEQKNLEATVYDYSEAVFDLYESLSGTSIEQTRALALQLNATDADEGLNGAIRYKVIGNTWPGVFELEPNSGRLYASHTPLKLQPNLLKYRLEVEARDRNGAGQLFDRTHINVQIKKVNRHAPKFRLPFVSPNGVEEGTTANVPRSASNEVHVLENLPPGTLVTVVSAEDSDEGSNGQVSYGFKVNGTCTNQTDEFEVHSSSGQLFSKTSFDRESIAEYRLVLCARDYLAEPQVFETLQSLLIRIIDVDDNEPQFDSQATFEFRVAENEARGTQVGRLQAIDRDHLPKHRRIRYELLDGNQDGRFHLQPDTGLLQLNASLDREQRDLYELIVKAIRIPHTSNGDYSIRETVRAPLPTGSNVSHTHQMIRSRSYNANDRSLALVRVHVLDLNDNAPTFEQSTLHVPAAFDTPVNSSLLHVTAIDADLSVNSTLTYSLVSIELTRRGLDEASDPVRPIPSPFRVHSDSGLLSVVQPLTLYPVGSRFKLHVQARERSAPYRIATAQVHVYVYERRQLIRFTVARPPSVVVSAKRSLERKLQELLPSYWRPMLTSVRQRIDSSKARVLADQSDCLLLVVDERQLADLNVPQVISRLDSQAADAHIDFDGQQLALEQVTPADDAEHGSIGLRALTSGQLPLLTVLTQQLGNDTQMVVLVALLGLIVIGLLCTFVSCCCLRSWYYQKLIERAERAQRASMMPGNGSPPLAKLPLGYGSEYGGTGTMNAANGIDEIYGHSLHSMYGYAGNAPLTLMSAAHTMTNGHTLPPNGTIRSTRAKTPASRQQVPPQFGTTK